MLAALMPRSAPASGSAMFTTDTSSTIISWAMAMTASASQRLGSGPVSDGTGAVCGVVRLSAGMAEPSLLGPAQWRGVRRAGRDDRRHYAVVVLEGEAPAGQCRRGTGVLVSSRAVRVLHRPSAGSRAR